VKQSFCTNVPKKVVANTEEYQIKVKGWLDERWSEWFDNMTITNLSDSSNEPVTLFTGRVIDQAALHGLLTKIYNLGLPLLSINRIQSHDNELAGEPEHEK
jgi:hypothetical protein